MIESRLIRKFLYFAGVCAPLLAGATGSAPADSLAGASAASNLYADRIAASPNEKTAGNIAAARNPAPPVPIRFGFRYDPENDEDEDEDDYDFSGDNRLSIEIGYSLGKSEGYGRSGRWQATAAYLVRVRPAFLAGLGSGALYYPHLEKGFMPVYADLRMNLTPHNDRSPFIDIRIGYAFLLEDREDAFIDDEFYPDRHGGIYFSSALGAEVCRIGRMRFTLSAGYSFHKIDYRDPDSRYVERISGIRFALGAEF